MTSRPLDPSALDLSALGAGLPVARQAEALRAAAASGPMVVTAPPGTGKTTFVPALLTHLVSGRVLLTQPRRVAVRAAARRISALDGRPLGQAVGFTVRGERHVSAATQLEVVTPGVLLRRLLNDPGLDGVGAVVLDEIHERSVDGDLLLSMLADLAQLREDLQVTAMSATVDADGVASVLGGGTPAAVVRIPDPGHPLTVHHAPAEGSRLDERGVTREFLDHLARVTARAHRSAREQTASGGQEPDALVFVPGAREVDEVVRRLKDLTDAEVLALHGRLSPAEQDRATGGRGPGEPARIVVSTSLAESSLTVPGVRLVVDSGLAREVRRDRGRDMTGLVTVSASRAAAEQRAGRAAREAPGTAIRAYSPTDLARMRPSAPAEITSADLTDAALQLACWGTPRGQGLALLTPPPEAALDDADRTLAALGLIDADSRPTAEGRTVAGMPVGAREAHALVAGGERVGAHRAAETVAALASDLRAPGGDLGALLRDLREGRAPGHDRWRAETTRLERVLPSAAAASDPRARDDTWVGIVVALSRPDRIARRTPEGQRTYLLASGTRAALPESSPLIGQEWLAVAEVQRSEGRAAAGTGAVIRSAAPLTQADALDVGASLMAETRTATLREGRVEARHERHLGAITLAATPVSPSAADTSHALRAHLGEHGLAALPWSAGARALRGRLALLHGELGEPWPAMDEPHLLAGLDSWLGPHLDQLGGAGGLNRLDVLAALRTLLPWPEAARLEELAPERLTVPSGSHIRVQYPEADEENAPPVLAVKLQEMFGCASTPRLVDGRVPVLVHLLSPAGRPLAVTADLASFWAGPYAQVRREMRGRYPKHPWPEDPLTAPATARTARRS